MKAASMYLIAVVLFIVSGDVAGQNSKNNVPTKGVSSAITLRFGYPPALCPPDTTLEAHHKDVISSWFVSPFIGSIDTIFIQMGDSIGAKDSLLYVRIHRSKVNEGTGPGYGYPPPPTPWGYWINTNDLDQGVAAFPEDGTNPTWQSTVDGDTPSFPLFDEELWGLSAFPVRARPNQPVIIPMDELPTPINVTEGDVFFVSARVNGPAGHPTGESSTDFKAVRVNDPMQSRAWAFWEHQLGWHALGTVNVNIWFSIATFIDSFSGDYQFSKGWNIVSVPRNVSDNRKTILFPTASSSAYHYDGSYVDAESLNTFQGYWIQFPSQQLVGISGSPVLADTIDVIEGWNLIGSLTLNVPASLLRTIPSDIATSPLYEFDNGYTVATRITAGKGYWIKVNQSGKVIISVISGIPQSTKLFSLTGAPPPPPFDEGIEPPAVSTFKLEQNYPNPFNPLTVIRYQLNEKSYVTLKIYNVIGKEVATIVDGIQDAGYKMQEWDATDVPSGVHYYKLTAGDFSQTRKLVLLR